MYGDKLKRALHLENEFLKVLIYENGSVDVLDKSSNVEWTHWPDGEPTGVIQLRAPDRGIPFVYYLSATSNIRLFKENEFKAKIVFEGLKCVGGVLLGGSMEISVSLVESSVNFTLEKIELPKGFFLEKIYYPFRNFYLEKSDEGYIVWPYAQGVIFPTKMNSIKGKLCEVGLIHPDFAENDIFFTVELPVYSCWHFSMPWFGAVKKNSAYIAIIDTPDDAYAFITVLDPRNKERLIISPIWIPSHGELRYPRSITYTFISGGDYVTMAKVFRKYAMEKGYYRSLREKIALNPNVERIIGAPLIKLWIMDRYPWTGAASRTFGGERIPFLKVRTTYKQVQEILKDMHESLGIDRALILLVGWGPMGYDNLHPDVWPPGRWAGEISELRKARDLAEKQGYLFGLHDNYQDIYLESPSIGVGEAIVKTKEVAGVGHPLQLGGVWEGGQAFIVCSKCGLKFAKRNIPQIMSDLSPTCYFVDTTTAAPLYECYDAEHPTTRSEDKKYKIELLKYLNDCNLVTGSESGVYWAAKYLHYAEGIMRLESGGWFGKFGGIPVPLFNLVYHDSIVAYWHQGQPLNSNRKLMKVKFLLDLLYGNPTSWNFFGIEDYKEWRDQLKEVFNVASSLHREIAMDEMVNHKFLTDDYLVQESEFSSGIKVIVNFGEKEFVTPEGDKVEPMGFIIKKLSK